MKFYIYYVFYRLLLYEDCKIYLPSFISDFTAIQLQATFQRALWIGSGLKRYAFLKAFLTKTVAFLAW